MDDEPGLLSVVLQTIARFHGNILTIHQSIPINRDCHTYLSVDILPGEGCRSNGRETIEQNEGIHYLKILGQGVKENDQTAAILGYGTVGRYGKCISKLLNENKESISDVPDRNFM